MVATTDSFSPGPERRTAIMSYLRENAGRYFTEFDHAEVHIELVAEQQRPQSRIYRFELKANSQVRFLRVKMPFFQNGMKSRTNGGQHSGGRPGRFSVSDPETKFQLEHAALSAIRKYFVSFQDPRFGTVNVLDSLPNFRATVMEEVKDPSLRSLFVRENRLQRLFTSVRANEAFRNAGSWLRAYHSLPIKATTRHQRRAEFIEVNIRLTDYLSGKLADTSFFQNVASMITAVALEVLPDPLPVGLSHGDYAIRNILVGPESRVTVLDTLARWRTAIFEDIGYFLTNLKVAWPQVLSQGLVFSQSHIEKCEQTFLSGYFGLDPIPIRAIRLYEIQALLDRWSGRVERFHQHAASRHVAAGKLKLALEDRYFKRSLSRLLKSITQAQMG